MADFAAPSAAQGHKGAQPSHYFKHVSLSMPPPTHGAGRPELSKLVMPAKFGPLVPKFTPLLETYELTNKVLGQGLQGEVGLRADACDFVCRLVGGIAAHPARPR